VTAGNILKEFIQQIEGLGGGIPIYPKVVMRVADLQFRLNRLFDLLFQPIVIRRTLNHQHAPRHS